MYDYGLALSGGGARGFAHLGVAQALDEAGIRPGIYAGTSAGAIAAAFLADGYAPGEVLDIFLQQKIYRIVGLSIPRLGLGNIQGMERVLRKHLKAKRIEDLKTPLIIAATDLNAGQVRYFDQGELIPRIIASASIPILFQPVKIDDRLYIDGGITDMLPVAPLEDRCRKIIGVDVNPGGYREEFHSLVNIAERIFYLSFSALMQEKQDKLHLLISPDGLESYSWLDLSHSREIYRLGYEAAKVALQQNSGDEGN